MALNKWQQKARNSCKLLDTITAISRLISVKKCPIHQEYIRVMKWSYIFKSPVHEECCRVNTLKLLLSRTFLPHVLKSHRHTRILNSKYLRHCCIPSLKLPHGTYRRGTAARMQQYACTDNISNDGWRHCQDPFPHVLLVHQARDGMFAMHAYLTIHL